MVYISDASLDASFTLDEYVDFVEREVDTDDYDSLVETSWSLRALANDRSFLLDFYHRELKALYDSQSGNLLTPQSVTLTRNPGFFVRANVWLPPARDAFHRKSEQKLYAYELPHDHNFDFVSVGYFGEGYETDLFTYTYEKAVGRIGEAVDLVDAGRETLGPGRIMVYKANYDVHVQYEPDEVSVSLNLIPLTSKIFTRPQFVFDPATRRISGGVSDQVGSRVFLLDFFNHLHNEESLEILETVMNNHPCLRTRGKALSVLSRLRPDDADDFRSKADDAILSFSHDDLVHAGYARQKDVN